MHDSVYEINSRDDYIGENQMSMGKMMKQTHGGSLYRPDKGETPNRRGRPRKFVSALRESGYSMSEVIDCIQVMLAMTRKELDEVSLNPSATALEVTIAEAIKKSIGKGSLYSIDCLLTRAYGKPRETTSVTGDMVLHTIRLG